MPTIQAAVKSGQRFLSETAKDMHDMHDTNDKACIWVDKVNYRIPPISYSYVLAALHATYGPLHGYSSTGGEIDRVISVPSQKVNTSLRFYRKLPIYKDLKDWQLLAYLSEGFLYLPNLLEQSIFGREGMTPQRYAENTTFAWSIANSLTKQYSSPEVVFFCMSISHVHVCRPLCLGNRVHDVDFVLCSSTRTNSLIS